ncbi:MAG: rhomboid family intramembrane serine protease [Alphaproteobacteria bacterium]|nr:rhomboid family intramembrane serine protease [Alphaproteobacteria bacterium]
MRRPPHQAVTVLLIVILTLAFYAAQLSGGASDPLGPYGRYGLVPAELFTWDRLAQAGIALLTAPFLHSDAILLAGSILFLGIFGGAVELALGQLRFLVLYLLCGVVGLLAHAAVNPGALSPALGAAAAVSGVLTGFLVLHPKVWRLDLALGRRVLPVQPHLTMLLWLVLQIYALLTATGVVTGASAPLLLGGALAGAILGPVLRPRRASGTADQRV